MNRNLMVGMALAAALVIPLAGCGGKVKLKADKMCASAGGKYNAQTMTCDAPAMSNRAGSDMCRAHGGAWDTASQTCEVGLD